MHRLFGKLARNWRAGTSLPFARISARNGRPTAIARRAWGARHWRADWSPGTLALMHEQALVSLASAHNFSDTRNGSIKRAGYFFTQALVPLESAQRATRQTNRLLQAAKRNSASAHRGLGQRQPTAGAGSRPAQSGRGAVRQGREQYQQLFVQSQVMQRKLRQLTRQILSAQEEERKADQPRTA